MTDQKLDDEGQFKMINRCFDESLSALKEDHAEWREWDDFYLSKHWSQQRPEWLPNPVVNYIAYVVDQKTPQLTNNRPRGLILPTAQGDEPTAKLFAQVTDVVADRVDLDDTVAEVVPTGLLLGIGWFKVYWDNYKSGGSAAQGNVYKGDVCIEAPDPVNVYHDPQAYKVEDCRYIIYAVPKTVEYIKDTFGVEVGSEQSFLTEIYTRNSADQAKNRVMLYEYWYKETLTIDTGMTDEAGKPITAKKKTINCIYAAGGKILKHMEDIYKHGRYPFVAFVPKRKRKSLPGIGEPKHIVANQKLLNKFLEMQSRHTMLTANPILLVDDMSGVDPDKFVAKPGVTQKVRGLKDGKKVMEWFAPPQISADVPKTIEKLVEFIERMGGVYDANTGETPGGVTAAAAIQMLMEQGSIPIKGISRNLYKSLKDVYKLIVELIKEFYTEERYIRITDDQGKVTFEAFTGAEYAEIDLDVTISAGASTPTSKAYIAQLGSDLFDKGVLLPSEYVDMQEGLPNKDKIVARLRELEASQQQAAAAAAQPPDPAQQQAQIDAQAEAEAQKAEQEFQQKIALKQVEIDGKVQVESMRQAR